MAEMVRTNDPAVLGFVRALLTDSEIPHQVTDQAMSVIEGSINAIRSRVLVPDSYEDEARQLLLDADLGEWLRPQTSPK